MVSHVGNLRKLLGKDKVVDEESIIRLYSREPSGYSSRSLPQALILAENVHDVSKLLSYAYRRDLKIYPQGSTTSLTGSAVPLDDGVILSLERMNRIKRISVVDSVA
ncbi:MAG: FAD-binding protein, partial [Desulfurococcales archaeon]|nr:FAD-binding protein [Desulfurococcales archaeon]